MRIISGSNKGKKLVMPNDKTTRPLKDMAKESIFNILTHAKYINFHIKDSKVLDLFSGIGSFGLECISRGSKFVFFLENYPQVLEILKTNISNLNYENKSKVLDIDAFKIDNNTFKKDQKFQIIFCDPPYKEKKIKLLIENLITLDILEKNGVIIIHRKRGELDNYPKEVSSIYQERRMLAEEYLTKYGFEVYKSNATMFLWAKLPDDYKNDSMKFSINLLSKSNVAVSPGVGFGNCGEGHIRLALVENKQRIRQAMKNFIKIIDSV